MTRSLWPPGAPAGLAHRLALALVSASLTWPAGLLGERLDEFLPLPVSGWATVLIGAAFGLLVMAPLVTEDGRRGLRTAALVGSSVLIYALAVRLAVIGYGPLDLRGGEPIVASGVLGALLTTVAVIVLAPLRPLPRIWAYALAAGLVGGLAFHYAVGADTPFFVAAGHAAWQLPVCASLVAGARRA